MTGAAFASYHPDTDSWNTQRAFLGTNKETYDAELFAVGMALKHALAHWDQIEGPQKKVTVCSDAQAALDRLQNSAWGPGQFLAARAIGFARELTWKGVRWNSAGSPATRTLRATRERTLQPKRPPADSLCEAHLTLRAKTLPP